MLGWCLDMPNLRLNTVYLNISVRFKPPFKTIPVRTSRNFFRLGSAFLEGEMAEPSLKKLREVQTQMQYVILMVG